jgi:transposase-like protein
MQPKVKSALHDVYGAPSRAEAQAAFDNTLTRFGDKYPKAMRNLSTCFGQLFNKLMSICEPYA